MSDKCGPCLKLQERAVPIGGQWANHYGFVARDQPYDCQKCIRTHAEQFQFPQLEPANVTAWNLYFSVQDQQRVGMDVIGLDYNVLDIWFRAYRIPRERWALLLEKVAVINHAAQEHHGEKVKAEREAAKQQQQGMRRG